MIPLGVLASRRPAAPSAGGPSFIAGYVQDSISEQYTFTDAALGDAFAGRNILVVACTRYAQQGRVIQSLTVGGIEATCDAQVPTTRYAKASVWRASVPSGTSADIVTTGYQSYDMEIAVYSCPTPTLVDIAAGGASVTIPTTGTGFYVAGAAAGRLSVAYVTDTSFDVDYGVRHAMGHGVTTGAAVNLTATAPEGGIAAAAYTI